jgi:glucose/arabinose dehydrogenase
MRAALLTIAFLIATLAACNHAAASLRVPDSFTIEQIAAIRGARELAALPNGDLLVGTKGSDVYIVPNAEANANAPRVFASFDDDLAAGVAFSSERSEIYVGTMHHVWVIPYHGERKATRVRSIADVRTGPIPPHSDGDVHTTTSVAYAKGLVYIAVGSSCNACVEIDPTRAAVSVVRPDGSGLRQRARRIRNAIALAVNPQSGSLWVGDAGQDDLRFGHPYEFLDDLSLHAGDADYGWPQCEENHRAYIAGANCSAVVEPLVVLPAYSTIIGAAFYPAGGATAYAFAPTYRGGLFVAVHGSWHLDARGCSAAPPRVVFVAMSGDRPATPVDWTNPSIQWTDFVTGFQSGCTARAGRPTGIAVGSKGSLFIADDAAGAIYRVRPKRG